MAKRGLPRTWQNMTERFYYTFIKPTRKFWLSPFSQIGDTVDVSTETTVVNARMYGHNLSIGQVIPISENQATNYVGPHIIEMTKARLEDEVARALRVSGDLVSPGDELKVTYHVMVYATARVKTWPDIPGITSIPWRPTGFEQSLPPQTDYDIRNRCVIPALYAAEHDVMSKSDAPYRMAWLAEPTTLAWARRLGIDEYVTLIEDERVPRFVLRLAEEIG